MNPFQPATYDPLHRSREKDSFVLEKEGYGTKSSGGDPNPASGFHSTDAPAGQLRGEARSSAGHSYNLTEREKRLVERERELSRREAELGLAAKEIKYMKPNWPSKHYPLEYHDIDEEIPVGKQAIVKRLYMNLLMSWGSLLLNWIAMLGIWFSGDQSGPSYTLWGTMYLIGVPGAWKLWYRPIYFAYRDKTTLRYFCFLLSFAFHCFFVVIMALGLPNMAAGGLMTMIQQFAVGHPVAAFLCFLSMLAWGTTAGLSFLNFKKVQNEWGKDGVDVQSITEQLRAEVKSSIIAELAN
ncbi:hypothetical protein AAMO2058_000228800 [Amorphochlora amoebiformis]